MLRRVNDRGEMENGEWGATFKCGVRIWETETTDY
jgi:hypothetical protein